MPVDIGSIKRNDQIAGAAAVLAFIFALIPGAVTASLKDKFKEMAEAAGQDTSDSVNLWHGLGVLAAILMLVGIAALAAAILQRAEVQSLPIRWITTGVWGLTSLLVLIYILTYEGDTSGVPSSQVDKVADIGPGIIGWILLLLCIVTTVFAAMGAQESGEQLTGRSQTAGPEATPPAA
jgi:hypothetical protein